MDLENWHHTGTNEGGTVGKVTVRKFSRRGRTEWVVDRKEGGARKRSFFLNEQEAAAYAREVTRTLEEISEAWRDLTGDQKIRLVLIHREAERRNIDLLALLNGTVPTTKPEKKESSSPSLRVVLSELAQLKLQNGLSRRYVDHLDGCLRRFARGREEAPIDRISSTEVSLFLNTIPSGSKANWRAMLSALFSFARRRKWIRESPLEPAERVKRAAKRPRIFTPNDLQKCLVWLEAERPRALAWFVLTTLCGLRPEEAMQTTWEHVRPEEGLVVVEAQTSKARQRRVVYPLPSALQWLDRAKQLGSDLPLNTMAKRRTLLGLREVLGWPDWPKDVTRHSAASYWLAECGSAEKVATMLGHSLDMLHRHYKALVTREQASAFWAVLPLPGQPAGPLSF